MTITNPKLPPWANPTGDAALAMMQSRGDLTAYMGDLFRHGYREAKRLLAESDADAVTGIIRGLHAVLDEENQRWVDGARERGKKVACSSGCSFCCYQHVLVTSPEALAIAERIEVEGIEVRDLDAYAALLEGVSHADRFRRSLACPMLIDKRCSIYADRPEECRSHMSLSRFHCEKDWRERFKREPGKGIPMLAEPKVLNPCLTMGADWALHEAGYQIILMELTPIVAQARKPGVRERWLAREAPFVPAVNDDYLERLGASAVNLLGAP